MLSGRHHIVCHMLAVSLLIAFSDVPVHLIFVLIASSDMLVISVTVLAIASVLCLFLFDVVCHVTRNRGVLNRLVRYRNRRRKYGKCKYAVLNQSDFYPWWRTEAVFN